MKLTLYAIKLKAEHPRLEMFWVGDPDSKWKGEFSPPRLQGPTLYSSLVEAVLAYAYATELYPPSDVEIVKRSLDLAGNGEVDQ